MEIILGKTSGFCYGVKRAVDTALEETKNNKNIYCLGELVHNAQVSKQLQEEGITFINDIKEISLNEKEKKMIIRAHGVSKEIYEFAKSNKIQLLDLTCPNVTRVHEIASDFSKRGYYIFLTGKKEHPENVGTISYCKKYSVIEELNEVENAINVFKQTKCKNLALISQTTYNLEKFYLIREKISYCLKQDEELESVNFDIENTICQTTETRQKETEKIAKKVDCMIIIGGKNSSNTRKLYEVSKKYCKVAYLVEDNIKKEEIQKFNKIGIMAGASTPEESVNKIVKIIKES